MYVGEHGEYPAPAPPIDFHERVAAWLLRYPMMPSDTLVKELARTLREAEEKGLIAITDKGRLAICLRGMA